MCRIIFPFQAGGDYYYLLTHLPDPLCRYASLPAESLFGHSNFMKPLGYLFLRASYHYVLDRETFQHG